MSFTEAIGSALMTTLALTGAMVLGLCLYLGARELLRRVRGERVERHLGHSEND